MKHCKLVLWIVFLCCTGAMRAQQRPHYTQYILNNYILNPAISGIENYIDTKLSVRNQWVGIPGAPTTFYATVQGPVGKKDFKTTATSFAMKGENPRGKQYWESYMASPAHHGVGFTMMNYRTGYINRFMAYGTYAYHQSIGPKTTLAAGFGAGISGTNLDRTKVELANPIDPAIGQGSSVNSISPEFNAGLWLYGADYFAGLSVQQIIPTKVTLVEDSYYGSTLVPHLFATAGYRMFMTEDWTVLPSVMLRYINAMPLFVDINAKFQYQDRFWLGGSYRIREGFAAMAGINISQTFNLSYSYDVNNANYLLGPMQKGTHEIVLGFLLNNGYGDMCPRNVW